MTANVTADKMTHYTRVNINVSDFAVVDFMARSALSCSYKTTNNGT